MIPKPFSFSLVRQFKVEMLQACVQSNKNNMFCFFIYISELKTKEKNILFYSNSIFFVINKAAESCNSCGYIQKRVQPNAVDEIKTISWPLHVIYKISQKQIRNQTKILKRKEATLKLRNQGKQKKFQKKI